MACSVARAHSAGGEVNGAGVLMGTHAEERAKRRRELLTDWCVSLGGALGLLILFAVLP